MVLGDNPPFSSGSDASGDNSCSSSSGNGSDPNTPAAVSGAEDGSSTAVISSSNDSLDQIVGSNGTASGTDDNESAENKLNEMAAQLALVSFTQQNQNSPSWDSSPTLHLGDPSSSSSSAMPTHVDSPAGQQLQQLLDARMYVSGFRAINSTGLSHEILESVATARMAERVKEAYSNQLNDQQTNTDNRGRRNRPIVSTPENFYPPADNPSTMGLNHNNPAHTLPAENHFQNWDFADIRLPQGNLPFPSQDADPQNSGFSVAGLFPSGGQGSSAQGFPQPAGNPLSIPHFSYQGSHFPPADHAGYVQGAEHQAAHESSGAQFHNGMGGMPEGAGGVVAEGAVGGMPDAAGSQHTSSGRGKPTFTECVDVQTSEHVAEIVGRQGCKIKELRARTQTYIRTPTREEPPIFTVTGVKEKVLLAAQEIRQMAAHFTGIRDARRPRPNNPNEVHLKMPLETGLVGLVVGTRGATIKKIQEESGAYIVTPNKNENENHISTFSIRGQPHEVKKAEAMIKEHINSRITPKDGSNGGMMHRHRAADSSSHRALLPRVIHGSSPPSPDSHLAGAGAQPAPPLPTNGFAAGNSVHSPPLSNSFNGIGSSSGMPAYPDSGYGAHHNGCASRHSSHSGAARSNGFVNVDNGDLGRPERIGHSYFMDSRTGVCSLGSEMSNGFGSNSRSSAFSGLGHGVSSGSFNNTTSSSGSSSSAGLSSSMNSGASTSSTRSSDRWNGGPLVLRSSARSPDRWNGGNVVSARSPDRWNGGTLVLRSGPGFGERRNGMSDSRTNGASSGALMSDWGSSSSRNGFSHGALNGGPLTGSMGGSSFASPDSAGLGPGTNGGGGGLRNGAHNAYNGASFNGASYNGASYNGASYNGASYNGARRNSGSFSYTDTFGGVPFSSSTPLNPAGGSHMQNGMPGSGPFDSDGLSDDWNRYPSNSNFPPNPRAYGRFSAEEQFPPMPFPSTTSSTAGPAVPALDGLDVFNSSSMESLVPLTSSMNQFAPTGLVTTSSFQSDPCASMTSAFSGSVLGVSSLLQPQGDLWASAPGSNGHAFPETPSGSKPQPDVDALPVDLSETFRILRFSTESKRTSTTTTSTENAAPEKAAETQENHTEATQHKEEEEEEKEEGAEREQQKEEEEEPKSS